MNGHPWKPSQKVCSFILATINLFGLAFAPWNAHSLTSESLTASSQLTLAEIAEQVADEFGLVTSVVDAGSPTPIFVFEERHDSRLGHVEIAIMLNRLYADHNLRHIGLEGHPASQAPLDLSWAHQQPFYQPEQTITAREDVLVQTLQDGEIGSAELLGLLYHDVVVDGIDDADLYAFDPPEGAWNAADFYLYYIALEGMNETETNIWNALYDSEKYTEAFEYAMSTDEFAWEKWQSFSDQVEVLSAENWLLALDELRAQAEVVGVDLDEVEKSDLDALGEFFEHVSQRSDAMVAAMLDLAAAYPEAPLAMTIGTLHTERVTQLLNEAGASFVVIRPLSLAEGSTLGLLSPEAYRRKQQGFSVAPEGHFNALVDGRGKMPDPTTPKSWYQFRFQIAQILQRWAFEAANGRPMEDVRLQGDAWEGIGVEIVDIFQKDGDANPTVQWQVRQRWVENKSPMSLVGDIARAVLGMGSNQESGEHKDRILLSGTVKQVEGTNQKPALNIFGRMYQGWQALMGEDPASGDSAGDPTKPDRICSTAEATSTIETGG